MQVKRKPRHHGNSLTGFPAMINIVGCEESRNPLTDILSVLGTRPHRRISFRFNGEKGLTKIQSQPYNLLKNLESCPYLLAKAL